MSRDHGGVYKSGMKRQKMVKYLLFVCICFCVSFWVYALQRIVSSVVVLPYGGKDEESSKSDRFSMLHHHSKGPILYKDFLRRRQETALRPLVPIARLNKTDIGKWKFRKVLIDGKLKPQYFNLKTHEVKWLKEPKDLSHYEEDLDKAEEVEGGGVLSLFDTLLQARVEYDKAKTDQKKPHINDEDEQEEDEDEKKALQNGKEYGGSEDDENSSSGRHVGEDNDDGGWVYSPNQAKADKIKAEEGKKKRKREKREAIERKSLEEEKKQSEKESAAQEGKTKVTVDAKESAKSLVQKYLADLRAKNVDYTHEFVVDNDKVEDGSAGEDSPKL